MDSDTQEGADSRQGTGPLIGLPQVLALVGLARTAWLDRVRDKTAPQPIKEGRRTLWVEPEVRAWIQERVRRYRQGTGA
jgi:predicted DNA-binding transcriptional regulator AlpA